MADCVFWYVLHIWYILYQLTLLSASTIFAEAKKDRNSYMLAIVIA